MCNNPIDAVLVIKFTDEEIIQSATTNQHDSDNDDEEEDTEIPVISPKDVIPFSKLY